MEIKSNFIADKSGKPKIIRRTKKFFFFASRTKIKSATNKFYVKTTRQMARGLMDYFLANEDFQSTVLKQNENAAVKHFHES